MKKILYILTVLFSIIVLTACSPKIQISNTSKIKNKEVYSNYQSNIDKNKSTTGHLKYYNKTVTTTEHNYSSYYDIDFKEENEENSNIRNLYKIAWKVDLNQKDIYLDCGFAGWHTYEFNANELPIGGEYTYEKIPDDFYSEAIKYNIDPDKIAYRWNGYAECGDSREEIIRYVNAHYKNQSKPKSIFLVTNDGFQYNYIKLEYINKTRKTTVDIKEYNDDFNLLNYYHKQFHDITESQYYEVLKYNLSSDGNKLENPKKYAIPFNKDTTDGYEPKKYANKLSNEFEDLLVKDESERGYQSQFQIYSEHHKKMIPVFNPNSTLKTSYLKLYYNLDGYPMYFHTEKDFLDMKKAREEKNIITKNNFTNEDITELNDIEKIAYKYITLNDFRKILTELNNQRKTLNAKYSNRLNYQLFETSYQYLNLDNNVDEIISNFKKSSRTIIDIEFIEKLSDFYIDKHYDYKEFKYYFRLITKDNIDLNYIKTEAKPEYDLKANDIVKSELHNKSVFNIFSTNLPLTLWKVEFYSNKEQYDNNEPEQVNYYEGNNITIKSRKKDISMIPEYHNIIDLPGIYKISLISKLTSGDGINGNKFKIKTKEIHFYDSDYDIKVSEIKDKEEELIGNEVNIDKLVFPNEITNIQVEYNGNNLEYDSEDNKISATNKLRKYIFKKSGNYKISIWDITSKPKIKTFNLNLSQPVVNIHTVDKNSKDEQVYNIEEVYYFNNVVYFTWKATKPYKSNLFIKNNEDKFVSALNENEFYQREDYISKPGHYKLETYLESDPNNKVEKEFIINKEIPDITFLSSETKDNNQLPVVIDYQKNDVFRTKDFFYFKLSNTFNLKFNLKIEMENNIYNGVNLDISDLKTINQYENFRLNYNGTYKITLTNIFGNQITKEITLDKNLPKALFKLDYKNNLDYKDTINYLNYNAMYSNNDISVKPDQYAYISGINIITSQGKESIASDKLFDDFTRPGLYEIYITNDLGLTNIYYLFIRKSISDRTIKIKDAIKTNKKDADPKKSNEFETSQNNPYLVNKDITLLWDNLDYLKKIEIYTKYLSDSDFLNKDFDKEIKPYIYKIIINEEIKSNSFILSKDGYYFIIYTDIFGNKYKLYLEIDKKSIKLIPEGLNENNKACSYVKFTWDENETNYRAYYTRAVNNKILAENEKYYRNNNFSLPGEYVLTIIDRAGNISTYNFEISTDPILYNLVDSDNNKYTGSEILLNKKLKLIVDNPKYKYMVNGKVITSDYIFNKEETYLITIENDYSNKVKIKLTLDFTPPEFMEHGLNNYNKSSYYVWFEIYGDDKAFLNGSPYYSKTKIKQDNKYLLEVYDKAGNVRKLQFEISHEYPKIPIYEKNTNKEFTNIRFNKPLYLVNDFQKLYVNGELITAGEYNFDKEGDYEIRVKNFFDMVADKTIRLKFKFSEDITTNLTKLKTNQSIYFNYDNADVKALLNNYDYYSNTKITTPRKHNIIFIDSYGNKLEYNFEIRYEFTDKIIENLGKNKKVNYPVKFKFNDYIKATLNNQNYISETEINLPGEHKIIFTDEFDNTKEYIFEQKFIFDTKIKDNLDGKDKLNKVVSFDYPNNITALLNGKDYYSESLINQSGKYKLVLTDEFGNTKEYNFELLFELKEPIILSQLTSKDNKISFEKINFNKTNIVLREGFKLDNINPNTKILVNGKDYQKDEVFNLDGEYKINVSDNFGNTKETIIKILHFKPKKDNSYIRSNLAIGVLTIIFTSLIILFAILFAKQRKGLAFKKAKNKINKESNDETEIKDSSEIKQEESKINPELEKKLDVLNDLENENNEIRSDK